MVEEKITTVAELYKRVLPALKSKRKELIASKLGFITENIIFECLRETKWSLNNTKNLTLYDIVNDILNITDKELITYISKSESRRKK